MYCSANIFRLSLLRLDGYEPSDIVYFCAQCDFQGAMPANQCPVCWHALQAIRATDAVAVAQAHAERNTYSTVQHIVAG
jgi:hypothetical protein